MPNPNIRKSPDAGILKAKIPRVDVPVVTNRWTVPKTKKKKKWGDYWGNPFTTEYSKCVDSKGESIGGRILG